MLYIYLFFIPIIRSEEPRIICSLQHPYKNKENSCENFSEVCVKKNDPECDAFQSVCQQCPASNYSISTFKEVVQVKYNQIQELTYRIKATDDIKQFMKINQEADRQMIILLSITIFLFVVSFLIMIVEMRFKLLTKNCEKCKGNRHNYAVLKSRKREREKNITESLNREIQSLKETIDLILPQILEKIDKLKSKKREITFRLRSIDKTVKLDLSEKHSIVEIKKKICKELADAEPYLYKIMTLKQNEKVFDNNQNLLPNLLHGDDRVDCEINEKIKHEEIVVLHVKGTIDVPKSIQISLNKTIDDLKQTINNLPLSRDIAIFKREKELKNEFTVNDYMFKDDDYLTVVEKKSWNFWIRSMIGDHEPIKIACSNTDKIDSICDHIKQHLTDHFKLDIQKIYLFINEKYVDENKFIYEYEKKLESIKYYYIQKLRDIKIIASIDKGYCTELKKGKNEITNTDVMIVTFPYKEVHSKQDKEIIKTLIQSQIKNSHKFIFHWNGLYTDENYLYASYEYVEGDTLTNYLKNNEDISDDQIRIWSKQILEYLQYIHGNGYIYIDLKPYEVYIDKENNVKMHSISMSNYISNDSLKHKIKDMTNNKDIPLTYLAPEVRSGKLSFNESADVWSFGVLLIRIVTGTCPDIEQVESKTETLEYSFPSTRSDELKQFIDSCVKTDPENRSTIATLIQHKFLNVQTNN